MGEALHGPSQPRGPGGDPHGWGAAAAAAGPLQQAQAAARRMTPELPEPLALLWRRGLDLARDAAQLAADVHAGRLRFGDPARALRAWRGLWARVCEVTGDLAAAVMRRAGRDTWTWRTARAVQHAAAEGVAHARGWLAGGTSLPAGSYSPPPGRQARTWVLADAATQLHDAGHGPLGGVVEYPGPLAGLQARQPARARPRGRAAPGRDRAPAGRTPAG